MKKEIKSIENKKSYIAPDIEVMEIEIEQNLFANSLNGQAETQDFDYYDEDY